MTSPDLTRRLDAIGLTLDDLAAGLGEHPDQVRAWLGIRGRFPRALARRLEWTLALAERDAALLAAGVLPCPTVAEMTSTADPNSSIESYTALAARVEAHALGCPVCQRREAVQATLPRLPPMPLPAWVQVLASLSHQVERLPPYLRPAVWGALAIGGLTLFRALLLLGLSPESRSWQTPLAVAAAVAFGAYAGAAGGIAYHLARRAFSRYGRLGDYLTGITVMTGLVLAFAAPAALFGADPFFRSGLWWVLLAVAAVLIGLVLGHRMFRTPTT